MHPRSLHTLEALQSFLSTPLDTHLRSEPRAADKRVLRLFRDVASRAVSIYNAGRQVKQSNRRRLAVEEHEL